MSIVVSSNTESAENLAAVNAVAVKKDEVVETKEKVSKEADEIEDESIELADAGENDESEDENKEVKAKKKGGYQKKIDRLNAENEYLKSQLAKPAETKTASKEAVIEKTGKPKVDYFNTHSEYVEALTDWKIEQKSLAEKAEQKKDELKSEQEKQTATFQKKYDDFSKATEDFQETIDGVDDIRLSAVFEDAIISSEIGPQIMYELAKNREELERLSKLSPMFMLKEIGKIEARLEKSKETKTEVKTKTTNAPPPPKSLSSKSASIKKSINDSDLSQQEYEAIRREQMAARPSY